jgi:hypothetical protein
MTASSCRACAAGRSGSKKRYAGWRAGALELVGLESVRRDWPAVARRLQRGLLERAFTDAPRAAVRARDGRCGAPRRARRRARLREARAQGRARELRGHGSAARAGRAQGRRTRGSARCATS